MTNYNTGTEIMASIIALLVLAIIFILILGLPIIIGRWKILTKANEEGWKCLIPFYNTYTIYKVIGISPYWILIQLGILILTSIVKPLSFIYTIAIIYIRVIYSFSLAQSFGKSAEFAVGIFFLEPIFILILAFGNSEYIGPKPMNDVVLNLFNKDNNNTNTQNQTINVVNSTTPNVTREAQVVNETPIKQPVNRFCTNCGTQIIDDSTFCTNCGNKLN